MKVSELRGMSVEQRLEKKKELQLELMKERAQIASGTSPKNPGNIREARKTIARILTLGGQAAQVESKQAKEATTNG